VGEVLEKIEEIQNKIDQAKGTAEQLKSYAKDIENLWKQIPKNEIAKEDWENICKELGKTNITKDLMGMMNLATDTNLGVEGYAESLKDLMQQYSDMLQTETDWVKIVDKEMFEHEICIAGVAIQTTVSFVVRLDLNMAMGSCLEYEVGKRYILWFKIGLFKPKAGTESMDLLDERFAFQFYVMGKLGAKMGVALTVSAGIGSAEIANVGITAEIGPYIKLYGFFIYEYEKLKPANTNNWEYQERMAGALYFEFGLYFTLSFEAEALNLFEYSYDFLDEEFPLAHAGSKRYQYSFAYEPQPDEKVRIVDEDGDSANGITMKLPESLIALAYVDLDSGIMGSEPYAYDNYSYTFSNPKFSIDENGVVSVNVPVGVQYIESDLTVTYLHRKLAFSKYDMSVTIPLVWTNLNDKELVEYYTASVRVGNDQDGYQTIWSKRVKKNEEFDLPSIDEVKKLINYSSYDYQGVNMKYENISDYSYPSKDLKIHTDRIYDIELKYKNYSVTVDGIENADGTKTSKTYTTQYGKPFDFSDLAKTGTNITGKSPVYTKFASITAEKPQEDIGNGELATYDLTSSVEGKFAIALAQNKVKPVASYIDDSISVTFKFIGIDHIDVVQKIKKGTEPNFTEIAEIVAEQGMSVKEISPALGKLFTHTSYTVTCGELTGPKSTISFEENGGSEVENITRVVGSLLGTLPTPTKEGYIFGGWYTDANLTTAFAENKMPANDITLYAKWTAANYTVTLNANGGSFGADENTRTINVTYGSTYGNLPTPMRYGKSFIGWFTDIQGGVEVKANTPVTTSRNHTLYARWDDLKEIPKEAFIFTTQNTTYQRGKEVPSVFELSEEYRRLSLDSFTFEYRLQRDPNAEIAVPIGAGTYDLVVKRPADNTYAQFEYRYNAVVQIAKATRNLDTIELKVNKAGYVFLELQPTVNAMDEYDISPEAKFTYNAIRTSGGLLFPADSSRSQPGSSYIGGLMPATYYNVVVSVINDPNYEDATSTKGYTVKTLDPPTDLWTNHTQFYNANLTVIEISKPEQLAQLAKWVRESDLDTKGYVYRLVNDLDMTGYKWAPITDKNENSYERHFQGTFDGNGHTIRGLYCDIIDSDYSYAGLFGILDDGAEVKNLTIEESYFKGCENVAAISGCTFGTKIENCVANAAIVGAISTGGIVGYSVNSVIDHCVNYGTIKVQDNYKIDIGGIAGLVTTDKNKYSVINCVNYGTIEAAEAFYVGGIVGVNGAGLLINNANFGTVNGGEEVGGVVGRNYTKNAEIYNCYSTGSVTSITKKFLGAVVGRNDKDEGTVKYCYYLKDSAKYNGTPWTGIGASNKALDDDYKDYELASFTSPTSALSRNAGYGTTSLFDALTKFVTSFKQSNPNSNLADWVTGNNGYPMPKGLPTYTIK